MTGGSSDDISIGVLRLGLQIPWARSLKDGRQVVRSLRDRVHHRFDVSFHEIPTHSGPTRRTLVITTAGNDARTIRSILDRVVRFVETSGKCQLWQVDVDVFRWHPPERAWYVGDDVSAGLIDDQEDG